MKKKILVVDDSALMRRVICDIIDSDERYEVVDRANNGLMAFDLLSRKTYDAVVLDVNMPKMDGLQLLKELRKYKIPAKVMMASTDTKEGAQTTLDALELGALDFIHKPNNAEECRVDLYKKRLLGILELVANSNYPTYDTPQKQAEQLVAVQQAVSIVKEKPVKEGVSKIVALASSTGGPKALQSVIPRLPKSLRAPVLIVQHMPKGFTASLAERLDSLSELKVKEAAEGDVLADGTVYVARGGMHMQVKKTSGGQYAIHYTDEPAREGVKPCANYMYESLMESDYDEVICVVMTGMGCDATAGIKNLITKKKSHVIAQNQETSVVYGMPKSIVNEGLSDQIVPLEKIAQEIILNVGVK